MRISEAVEIINDILAGKAIILRSNHFLNRLAEQDYVMPDARKILRDCNVEDEPEYDSEHDNYVVRLRGVSLAGRDTRLVVGLRWYGHHTYITIVDIQASRLRRTSTIRPSERTFKKR